MSISTLKLEYVLRLADDALVISHRLGEWCGHGPILEQDIALTNTALDHLGRARSLFQYAAELFNKLPFELKKDYFASVSIQNKVKEGANIEEDDLAFLRDGWDFKNLLLLEQPNTDWAFTIARSLFYDTFNYFYFKEIVNCNDEIISGIAAKSLKEVTYHLKWSSDWVLRLGDGTDESILRMQNALNELWKFTGELFFENEIDTELKKQGIAPDIEKIKLLWSERINSILKNTCLKLPDNIWMQKGGRVGMHTEYLGYILADAQFMQRTYPNMQW